MMMTLLTKFRIRMRSQLHIPKTRRLGVILYYFIFVSEDNVFQSGDMVFEEYKKETDCDIWENGGVSDENVAINIYRFVETFQSLPCLTVNIL